MGVVFVDGFDWWNNTQINDNYLAKYPASTGSFFQGQTAGGRFGGQGFQLVNTAFWSRDFGITLRDTSMFTGRALKLAYGGFTPPGHPVVWLAAKRSGAGVVSLALSNNANPDLLLYTGGGATNLSPGSLIATIPAPFSNTDFVFVELVNTPTAVEVWLDDVNALALPMTLATPDTLVFRWENFGTWGVIHDDSYIADSLGPQNNTRLGPCRVVTLFPSADGVLFGWTSSDAQPHFTDVGSPILRGPQPYLEAVDSAADLFVFPGPSPCGTPPGNIGKILAVAANAAARAVGLVGSLEPGCWPIPGSGSPQSLSSAAVIATPSSYNNYQAISEVNLRTGGFPWTASDISRALWGPMVSSGRVRCAEFYLEVLATLRPVPVDCTSPTSGPNSYGFSS